MCLGLARLHSMKHILTLPCFAKFPAGAIVSISFLGEEFHKASSI